MSAANVTRRGFFGNVAGAYATVSTVGAAAIASTSIADLFERWKAVGDGDVYSDTEDASKQRFAQYQSLQNRIIRAEAKTPIDLAIQWFVDTDGGGSEMSEEFSAKLRALAQV